MSTTWGYRNDVRMTGDLVGYDVEATDGHIGKVDEASFDDEARGCIVVDTGFWIFGKKRLVPAGVVNRIDPTERRVFVSMTKDQVKSAPDWDATWRSNDTYRKSYDDYYSTYIR